MIPQMESDLNIIQQLDDYPNDVGGLTPDELKAKFDESGLTIQEFLNEVLIPAITSANIPFTRTTEVPEDNVRAAILNVQQQAAQAVSGSIPNGSISSLKLTQELNEFLSTLRTDATNTEEKAEQNKSDIEALAEFHGQDIQTLQSSLSELSSTVSENYEHFTGEVSRLDDSISSLDGTVIETGRELQALDSRVSPALEAGLWNSAVGLLAAAHAGQNTSMSERVFVDALKNDKKTSANTHLSFGENGAELLTDGYSGESGTLNHVEIEGQEKEVCKVTPTAFGTMTKFSISGSQSYGSGVTLTLSVYRGSEKLTEKAVVFSPTSQGFTQDFSVNYDLIPNTEYTFKIKHSGTTRVTIQMTGWTLTATPNVFTSGSFETKDIQIPEIAKKIRILCRASTQSHTISASVNGGAYESLTLTKKTDEGVAISTASKNIQSGNTQIKLKFELNGSGESIYDYAVVFV